MKKQIQISAPPPNKQRFDKKMLFLFLFAFFVMSNSTIGWSQNCLPPDIVNHVSNPSFEQLGTNCSMPTGTQIENAFNQGCAPLWASGVGSPSLCNATPVPGNAPGTVFAPDGDIFACLGASNTTDCFNESIVQTVDLCPGTAYNLSFQFANLRGTDASIVVFLTDFVPGLCEENRHHAVAAANLPALPANTPVVWQTYTSPVPILVPNTSPVRNLLVFAVFHSGQPLVQCDVGLDNIKLTCAVSALNPLISSVVDNGSGSYNFNGTTDPAPSGNELWCWDFGDGTIANGQNVSHTYAFPGYYKVCLTVADNCRCTASICTSVTYGEATPCPCTGENQLHVNAGSTSTNPNALLPGVSVLNTPIPPLAVPTFFSPHTLLNTCLSISGNLVIPSGYDLAIVGGEVRMQPGARITVRSGARLTIAFINTSGGMHGCETMWRGIQVEPGGLLRAGHNTVQDAEYAVQAQSTSTMSTDLSIFGNDFDRNHVGLRVNNTAVASMTQVAAFVNNTFHATSNLLPKYSIDVTNWQAQNPYAGLFLRNTSFIVGTKGNPSASNVFDGMRNGIVADATSLSVYYAKFLDAKGTMSPYASSVNINNSQGLGLVAQNCVKVEVLNSTFDKSSRAVHTLSSALDFRRNVVKNTDVALYDHSPGLRKTNIHDNDIYFKYSGINVLNAGTASEVFIDRNDPVELEAYIPGTLPQYAILLSGPPAATTAVKRIANNKVVMPHFGTTSASYGIGVGGAGGSILQDNQVLINNAANPSPNFITNGIEIGADNCYLYHNTVVAQTSTNGMTAISLGGSKGCVLCCNITNRLYKGLEFSGYCDGTKLWHSDIGDHHFGLDCWAGTTIGDQTLAGNKWNGTSYFKWAQHLGDVININGSEFRVELPVSQPLWPDDPYSPAKPDEWFLPFSGTSSNCASDQTNCPTPIPPPVMSPGPRNLTENEGRIAQGAFVGTDYGGMTQFEGGRSLYREMQNNLSLFGQLAEADQFHSASSLGTIGQLYEVEQQVATLWSVPSVVSAQLAALEQQVAGLMEQINRIDSLYQYAATVTDTAALAAQKRGYFDALNAPLLDWQTLLDNEQQSRLSKVPNILAQNNAVTSGSVLVNNRKIVYRIYLETFAAGIDSLTLAQRGDLLGVATQCFLEGGDAVLLARRLYNQTSEPIAFDNTDFCGGQQRPVSSQHAVSSPQSGYRVSVTPNPAKDRFTVLVQGTAAGALLRIKVTALNGKLIHQSTVQNGEVLVCSFTPGLYLCQVFVGEEPVDVVKIIVLP